MINAIMSKKVVTAKPDVLLRNVISLMDKYDFKEIPIADKQDKLLGLVSYFDILNMVKFQGDSKISNFMSTRNPFIKADMDELDAIKLIVNSGNPGLPVVNSAKKIVGFVSDYDLLKFYKDDKSIANLTVNDFGVKTVSAVREDANISEVRKLMTYNKVDRLPVVDKNGKFVGTVLSIDILRMFYIDKPHKIGKFYIRTNVDKIMDTGIDSLIRPSVKIGLDSLVKDAIEVMIKNHIVGLSVVNSEGAPIGVIDRQMILKKIIELSEKGTYKINISGEGLNSIIVQELSSVIKNNLKILPRALKSVHEVKVYVKAVHKDLGEGKIEMSLNVIKDGGNINIKRVGYDLMITLIDCLDTAGQLLK